MSETTKYYDLPIIDPKAKFDAAGDINKLANSIDHVMQHIEEVGKDSHYVLPPATKTSLGGVIPGDNVTVKEDGTISVNVNPYELPPASHSSLGGVIVPTGSGISLDPDGTIGIDNSVIGVPDGSVTTDKIANEAVSTAKIAKNAVTYEKLSSALQGEFDKVSAINAGTPQNVPLDFSPQSSAISNVDVTCSYIAGLMTINGTLTLLADGSTTRWPLCNPPFGTTVYRAAYSGLPALCAEAVDASGNTYGLFFDARGDTKDCAEIFSKNGYIGTEVIPAGSYTVTIQGVFFYTPEMPKVSK